MSNGSLLCESLYQDMLGRVEALARDPVARKKYPHIINSGIDALKEARDIKNSLAYSNPQACYDQLNSIYNRVGFDLQATTRGDDSEFPWTPMFNMPSTSGFITMAGLRSFVDPQGHIRPDTELSSAARTALRRYYILKPVGSETTAQLEDRIVGIFVNNYGLNWNAGMKPEDIIGDVSFHEIVTSVSPLSVPLKDGNTPYFRRLKADSGLSWWAIAALGFGVVMMMTPNKRGGRK